MATTAAVSNPTKISEELREQIRNEVRQELERGRAEQHRPGSEEVVNALSLSLIRAALWTIGVYLAIVAFTIYLSSGGQALSWIPGLSKLAQTTDVKGALDECKPICPSGYRLDRIAMPACTWTCESWLSTLWPLNFGGGARRTTWHGVRAPRR